MSTATFCFPLLSPLSREYSSSLGLWSNQVRGILVHARAWEKGCTKLSGVPGCFCCHFRNTSFHLFFLPSPAPEEDLFFFFPFDHGSWQNVGNGAMTALIVPAPYLCLRVPFWLEAAGPRSVSSRLPSLPSPRSDAFFVLNLLNFPPARSSDVPSIGFGQTAGPRKRARTCLFLSFLVSFAGNFPIFPPLVFVISLIP